MVVRMRHTRAHTANRRSHHALKASGISLCSKCGNPKMKHVACSSCGTYKGRDVLNTIALTEKKLAKRKQREKEEASK